MSPEGGRALGVTADLSIEVDGTPVHVRADGGSHVHVVADDVRGALAAVRDAAAARTGRPPGRADLARMADSLAAHGLTAHVEGPDGPVVTLGADVGSTTGAVALGTRRARLHVPGVLRVGRREVRAVALAAGAVLVAVLAARRRR
ncbi:hypothetical protein OF117_14760 [Geodermatophilus sp. YIM 151500]|uniref:hypothetical protein n=1 Tax=Geodermatophilus sp. YIM 151500 TaxID=2984531 RepID=UPI0021E39969|nr:hypothetical protein [Geodermatophilus sp. YIM 151500]MCV2490622.1 hypothetical protein [Geodermatophilus sp. YIM 151500]